MMQADDSLYQVSSLVENVGKRQPRSKKRITWTFTDDGEQHEHTVTFLWSKRTGKQFVFMHDAEVYFGRKKGASVFYHKWTSRDERLKLHILACAATPSKQHVASGFRKYELIVNGQPFSSMPTKDGAAVQVQTPTTPEEDQGKPSSILDILYPKGYEWDPKSTKGEAKFHSHAKLRQEVSRRVVTQSTYNANAQSSAN
jgi:hypothetical protein